MNINRREFNDLAREYAEMIRKDQRKEPERTLAYLYVTGISASTVSYWKSKYGMSSREVVELRKAILKRLGLRY